MHTCLAACQNSLRQGNLDALAVYLDHNIVALTRNGFFFMHARIGRDVVVPFGLNPAGVNAEFVLCAVADECRLVDNLSVERKHGR